MHPGRGGNLTMAWRRFASALAFVGLSLGILVPPGFMVSGAAPQGVPIVICTGHGALGAKLDFGGSQAPEKKNKAPTTCAFAGHGGAPILASVVGPTAVRWDFPSVDGPTVTASVVPGRGLAAPPPQSRAPPTPSI